MESRFGILEGVIRTRVGYAGGTLDHPNYGNMGDHTEAVQIDYDPTRITYAQLLNLFWNSHNPSRRNRSRQYMNAVFYHDDAQQTQAEASKTAEKQNRNEPVHSGVLPLRSFTWAEDYHQKFLLKRKSTLLNDLSRIYPRHRDLVNSTAASRLNGYADSNGTTEQLSREIDSLGLSPSARQALQKMVENKGFFN